MNWQFFEMFLPGFVIGLTVHEASHALSAKLLGDRRSEKMGRISLNPMRHLSAMGTVALFIIHFGWGKPVEVNLYNFKKPKFYYLLSSLAGPFANLMVAGVCLGVMYLLNGWYSQFPEKIGWVEHTFLILSGAYLINCILAVFNLLPIPPLDGSKIWPCIIPGMRPISSGKTNLIWFVVLFAMMQTDVTSSIIDPVIRFFGNLLPY